MSMLSFSSLKGGVGKTSLSINVAHAFAESGMRVLLVDLDPTSHCTRLFFGASGKPDAASHQAPLARFFLSRDSVNKILEPGTILTKLQESGLQLTYDVRNNLSLLPGGEELRYCMWGLGAKAFASYYKHLLSELQEDYDLIVVDTAPDLNVVTRTALAASDVVCIPVDSSAMSIDAVEQLFEGMKHVKKIKWSIVRTMVNRRASVVRSYNEKFLSSFLSDESSADSETDSGEKGVGESEDQPIYLLNTLVPRTESQNRLTFIRKTVFDKGGVPSLRSAYYGVSKELLVLLNSSNGSTDGEEEDAEYCTDSTSEANNLVSTAGAV